MERLGNQRKENNDSALYHEFGAIGCFSTNFSKHWISHIYNIYVLTSRIRKEVVFFIQKSNLSAEILVQSNSKGSIFPVGVEAGQVRNDAHQMAYYNYEQWRPQNNMDFSFRL